MDRAPHPTPTPASGVAKSLTDPAFLLALCHDLRGPLGAIGTWLHVLGSGKADAATEQQALAAMQRDVGCQRRLIERLDDLSSILGGTLVPSIEEVDLVALLQDLGVRVEAQGSSPRVLADPARLRQLLAILLAVTEGTFWWPRPKGRARSRFAGSFTREGPVSSA